MHTSSEPGLPGTETASALANKVPRLEEDTVTERNGLSFTASTSKQMVSPTQISSSVSLSWVPPITALKGGFSKVVGRLSHTRTVKVIASTMVPTTLPTASTISISKTTT